MEDVKSNIAEKKEAAGSPGTWRSRMENMKPVLIMLVEDDEGDQKLTKISLAQEKVANEICLVESGEDALDYLARCKAGAPENPIPDLILLDLNMPGMGGKEFLKRLKRDDDFRGIPVVVLTTSDSDQDILESYDLQAAGYIKKPVTLDGFRAAMREVGEYWFVVCRRMARRCA
ncbi:MAG: response regulator [Candidatus Eisenbacteria bacterium]